MSELISSEMRHLRGTLRGTVIKLQEGKTQGCDGKSMPKRIFIPTFQWQIVEDCHILPSGLEIKVPLSGESRKMAKISDPWRAQFFLGDGEGFYRGDIHSTWKLRDLRLDIASRAKVSENCVTLSFGEDYKAPPSSTDVLGAAFFQYQRSVKVAIDRTSSRCLCGGVRPCQHLERKFHGCQRRCTRHRRERLGKLDPNCDPNGDTSKDCAMPLTRMTECQNACTNL